MGCQRLVAGHGIERHQSATVGIADILWNGKGDAEPAFGHVVGSTEERLGAVFIHKGLIGLRCVVLSAGNRLFGISYRQCHHAAEATVGIVILRNVAAYSYYRACCQFDAFVGRYAIDAVDYYLLFGCGQL